MWSFVIYNEQTNKAFYQEIDSVKNRYFITTIMKIFTSVQKLSLFFLL